MTSSAPHPSTHIFLTGVTGYIGGSVFHHLLHSPLGQSPSTSFTVLVRPTSSNQSAITALKALPNVSVALGSHDDLPLVQRLTRSADVIVHTADSADDLPSAKGILSGLTPGDGKRRVYIHTSGTGILTFGKADARGEYATPDDEVWDDLQYDRYTSIPADAPHRDIDSLVIDAAKAHPSDFDLVIISPPTIYGQGKGPANRLSQQIPTVIRMTLASGHPGTVGPGLNKWNSVHIDDLADLYTLIVRAYRGPNPPPSITQGGGVYFAATGEFVWGDVQRAVGEELTKRGLVKEEFKQWTAEESERFGGKFVWMAIGSNSRCRSVRAEKEGLGWKPKHVNGVLSTIPADIDEVLARQQKEKESGGEVKGYVGKMKRMSAERI